MKPAAKTTGETSDQRTMSTAKKWLVGVFLLVHIGGILHNVVSSSIFFPAPPYASGFTFLGDAERALNRRHSQTPLDNFFKSYERLMGISQQWNTFAPVPGRRTARYSVIVKDGQQERVAWHNGVNLEGGSGWVYDPRIKLSEMFAFPYPEFQRNFVLRTGTSATASPEEIRFEADAAILQIDSQGDMNSERRLFTLLTLRR